MIEESDPIVRTAERLCETLERIGDALVALDADTLLETEETLEQLLAALGQACRTTSVQDKPALAASVRRAACCADALPPARRFVFGNCRHAAALADRARNIRPRRGLRATRRVGNGRKGDDVTCPISSRCSYRRSRALDAQRYGLDVTGQNIANVNTPGYTRRSAMLRRGSAARSVERGRRRRRRSWWRRVRRCSKRASASSSRPLRAKAPSPISSPSSKPDLGQPGASLDAALARFYNTYAALAQSPTSTTARQQVIIEGQSLSRAFNDLSTSFSDAQTNADREIRDTVSQVNALAKQLADINAGIASAGPENADGLLDQQSVALASLTELVDVNGHAQRRWRRLMSPSATAARWSSAPTRYDLTATSTPPHGIRADHFRRRRGDDRRHVGNHRRPIGGLLQVRDVAGAAIHDAARSARLRRRDRREHVWPRPATT